MYRDKDKRSEISKLQLQVDHYAGLLRRVSTATFSPNLDLLCLNPRASYPISTQWYTPLLLQFCSSYSSFCDLQDASNVARCMFASAVLTAARPLDRDSIDPKFSRAPNSNESSPPDLWMQAAFSDPCMFHAVLFAASSHLDVIRMEHNNPITYYHHRNTVRLLTSNISKSSRVPEAWIAATLHLWHYDVSWFLFSSL